MRCLRLVTSLIKICNQRSNWSNNLNFSPRMQSFVNGSYNQEMMERFFKHNPNGLVVHLISQGARLPPGFDWFNLNRPSKGDLVDQPIIDVVLHPPPMTFSPTISLPPNSTPPNISHPQVYIPSDISNPPILSLSLHNLTNYINTSFPPISTIRGSLPQVTSQPFISSYQYISGVGIPSSSH